MSILCLFSVLKKNAASPVLWAWLAISIFACASLSSAAGINYRDAIKDAMQNSARVRVKVEDINISDAVYRQNFAGLFPEITANSRFERYENLDKRADRQLALTSGEVIGGDVSAWRSSMYLWGQYYLSHWYKKRFEAKYYEGMRDVRVYECDAEVKKMLRELTDVFAGVAEGRIKLKYVSGILLRLQEVLYLKKQAFAKGQVSYEEVLKVEADVANTEKELGAVRKEFRENLERLGSYTGKAYSDDIEVEGLVSDGEKQLSEFMKIIEKTPEYAARKKELEAARFRAKGAANNFWPDVSMYGRYDYYGSNTNNMESALRDIRETAYTAGIMISLPLFDGGVRMWERRKNLFEVRRQEESLKAVMEEKGRDIKTLYAGYTELSKSIKHYRKLLEQYEKMLDITKKAHGFGERSRIDIMEMEKESLSVERDLKVTEHALAAYEKRLALEADYKKFMSEYYGDRACKY